MEIEFSASENAFRLEVRDFLRTALPPQLSDRVAKGTVLDREDWLGWQRQLHARGWAAPNWPVEYGGTGWDVIRRYIFDEECSMANAPRLLPFGILMLGPVLQKFGTPEQQACYLPRILSGSDWWAQGYSEPEAGSDLAAIRTRAIREGDCYVVNGQKTWISLAQHANKMFILVRTRSEGPRQKGISFLLCDLDAPGIEIRPIRLLEGGHEVNEVFFTDVRVPVANLVGQENDGWNIAKYLLGHERAGIAGVGLSMRALADLKELSRRVPRSGHPLIEDPLFAARLARVEIDLEALRLTNLRMLLHAEGRGTPGIEASILKIQGSLVRQTLMELLRQSLGTNATPFLPLDADIPELNLTGLLSNHTSRAFNHRKLSIFGGSNEVQKEIIARELLGF
jgi:alkylation response protein AidB-like acyl-CoA dehydrogenase